MAGAQPQPGPKALTSILENYDNLDDEMDMIMDEDRSQESCKEDDDTSMIDVEELDLIVSDKQPKIASVIQQTQPVLIPRQVQS